MLAAGLAAAGAGWFVRLVLPEVHPIATAAFVLGAFGATYFAAAHALGLSEATTVLSRLGQGSTR
jgi:hypothetical protein